MKLNVSLIILPAFAILMMSCGKSKNTFDASGSFESEETIISAEGSGVINEFNIEEGDQLLPGTVIGYIDTIQLYLKKKQLEAQMIALDVKKPNVAVQLAALQEQLRTAQTEQIRIKNLVKADAATTKQLDDINASIDIIKKQIDALRSTLNITSSSIDKESLPIQIQIEQINDQIQKCKIVNPVKGTVLTKYAEKFETTMPGKPLYKIADLTTILLRTYITGDQLPLLKLNQKVVVSTDDGKGGFKQTDGIVIWINDKAEFTPKTIQTKDERANMVYATKISVKNDGTYKIGMYGEINFQ